MLRIHKRVNIFFYTLNCRLEGEGVAQSLRFVDLVKMLKIGDGPLDNSEGEGHFRRERLNQRVLMQGLNTPTPSESVPFRLYFTRALYPNRTRRKRTFNACDNKNVKDHTYPWCQNVTGLPNYCTVEVIIDVPN